MDSRKRTLDDANASSSGGDNGVRRRRGNGEATFQTRLRSSAYSAHNVDHQSVVPLSMQVMRPFWLVCCANPDCDIQNPVGGTYNFEAEFFRGSQASRRQNHRHHPSSPVQLMPLNADSPNGAASGQGDALASQEDGGKERQVQVPVDVGRPGNNEAENSKADVPIEQILQEYRTACQIYGCSSRINPGVLTALRFGLPTLRVSGNFFDADCLALTEVLLHHCNGALRHITRLDFSVAAREGKSLHSGGGGGTNKRGIRSHGAYALSRLLTISHNIEEIYFTGNRIGPYGASRLNDRANPSSIFHAAASNPSVKTLLMRGCRIGERGALIFVREILDEGSRSGLTEVDLSTNRIGFRGCFEIEEALKRRDNDDLAIVLDGNMVLQEVMNCVTRSYTPFLMIALHHEPLWSLNLLLFIWASASGGILVEATCQKWKHKSKFSLAMYLTMGWCCMMCLPDLIAALPSKGIGLLVAGGLAYTGGVPFFIRNNNLDHSIWHLFVLAGSVFHWLCVYLYVAR
ncbi:hypothetical protein THAOC_13081 [Thalassiosira oceanica]|uniref:Uncharacterized protein n=1 Tax=Thalassiosira oceanica TaxID=159749 RepID=K0T6E7_THAOC|nr:hypothetical protein THAOC_13081 [Thalassiosira oceanica]|eukprot:EJK66017.1 hypothetical protein THAOC_13081 [Thalassiosira oceanica]